MTRPHPAAPARPRPHPRAGRAVPVPSPDPPQNRGDHPCTRPAVLRAERFTHPFTRRLLTHQGSTTALLEQHLATRLTLRLVSQNVQSPHAVAATVLPLLGLDTDVPWLVRRTELHDGSARVVSRNLVMGPLPRRPEMAGILTSATVPLGRALAGLRLPQERRLLRVGRSPWPPRSRPAAWRGYVLAVPGESPWYVEEFFHPDIAPAHLRTAPGPAPGPAATRATP
ncbi:hypothetical protein AB0L35_11180 [Streptomyces sp. NPDC052309]|uniref:hypothetical protein n=1 Tax=Streptomyces sp. NPDC052309 TaxID=3155421 RepID=UPI003449FF2D